MKKITKFLDSVMGGIKRTCIAKALAVFAVASIAINANAHTVDAQGVVTGIDKLVGKTQTELLNNAVTSTTFPTNSEKQFFLYNVKTGRLLNAGGYWGTHVALKEYGKPLAVENAKTFIFGKQKIKLIMEMAGTEGKYVGCFGVPSETEPDNGTYVDRRSGDVYEWILEEVKDENRQNKQNTYKLYTYCKVGSDWATDKKYYLCSNKGLVDAKKNCEAYPEDSLTVTDSKFAGYDEWRFLSYQQILDLQAKNADELNDALELSFKLKCPGFSRGDNDIKSWKTYNYDTEVSNSTDDGFARFGLFKYYNTIAGPNTSPGSFTNALGMQTEKDGAVDKYTFDGEEYYNPFVFTGKYNKKEEIWETNTEAKPYQRNLSKYFCASITNKRGTVYQDIVVTTPGRYQIECKGFSTTEKAKLFAGVLKSDNTMVGKVKTRTLNQVSNMSQEAKDALHVKDKNVDYAGKNFYGSRQYINTVYVTVNADDMTGGKATIRLGIRVGDDLNDKTPVTTGDGEWTVFDDFRMLYAAKEVKEDLILDEMRDNLSYLVNCPTPMENKTLHLNKTFTLNKWNSFILPVNLNKKQVTEAFGGDARLAKLTRLTDTGIEFTSVNLLDSNSTAIEAYMPYIIFPVKGPGQTEAYTANYQQNNNNTNERLNINIPANHYVIGKVSMPLTRTGDVKANDWSNMDQTNWTTTLTGGNNQIKAYGTFARTFGEATQNEDGTWNITNKGTIIPGRPTLEHSYFFDKGNMYHSTGRPRGLRGFSCWFEPVNGKSQNASFTLDGVSQGTTGIEDILADYEQPVSRFANGIYNLNGQLVKQGNSTAGLPSGLYIVNGKKCIVR